MILCHSPLKTLVPQFHDKYVLLSGYGDLINVGIDYGLKKPLLCEELFALMPALSPLNIKLFAESHIETLAKAALKRFGKDTKEELLNDLQISAIMMLADCFWHELHLQIFTDLIRSKDGRIGHKGKNLHFRKKDDKQFV